MPISVSTQRKQEKSERLLDAYYAEYTALRAELLARVTTQNQAFNFMLIILGVSVSAVVTILNKQENQETLFPSLIGVGLFLPLITIPLALIFFDNEIMIHSIGSHLHKDLRQYIGAIVEPGTANDRLRVFKSTWEFTHLHCSTEEVFHSVSVGRWFIFLVPTFLPPICLLLSSLRIYQEWLKYCFNNSTYPSALLVVVGGLLYTVDCFLLVLLCRAIRWIFDTSEDLKRASDIWCLLFGRRPHSRLKEIFVYVSVAWVVCIALSYFFKIVENLLSITANMNLANDVICFSWSFLTIPFLLWLICSIRWGIRCVVKNRVKSS